MDDNNKGGSVNYMDILDEVIGTTEAVRTEEPEVSVRQDDAVLNVLRLVDDGSTKPGEMNIIGVEDVQDRINTLHEALTPQDIERPLNESRLVYDADGRALLSFRNPDGSWGSPMTFTRSGFSQIGSRVLGAGGPKFVSRQAARGGSYRQLAEMNWALEMALQQDVSLVRTVQFPGQDYRTVRATLSQSYGCFDNLDVLDTLLEYDDIHELAVVNVRVDENAMRIRFCLDHDQLKYFNGNGGLGVTREALNIPLKILEVWNSETGQSSVRARSSILIPRCLNGISSHESVADWKWFHRAGSGDHKKRISDGLGQAITSARVKASGQVEDYQRALEVQVNDLHALINSWGGDLTGYQIRAAQQALANPVAVGAVPSGVEGSLQAAVDAVTWAAQQENDMFRQRDIEQTASRILSRGLRVADRTGGEIEIQA